MKNHDPLLEAIRILALVLLAGAGLGISAACIENLFAQVLGAICTGTSLGMLIFRFVREA